MPTLNLSNPTSVARAGSTDAWSTPSESLTANDAYAQSGPIAIAEKSEYLVFEIGAPGVPFVSLPPMLTLRIECQVDPDGEDAVDIVFDVLRLGTGTTPAGTNVATNAPLPLTDNVLEYGIPTDGITLSNLNSGAARLFVSVKAIPTVDYDLGDVEITLSGVGSSTVAGAIVGTTPWVASPYTYNSGNGGPPNSSGSTAGTITYSVADANAVHPEFVLIKPIMAIVASGTETVVPPVEPYISWNVNDGLGTLSTGADSDGYTATTNGFIRVPLDGNGEGSETVTVSTSSIAGAGGGATPSRAFGSITPTYESLKPVAATAKIDIVTLTAPDAGSPLLFEFPYRRKIYGP